MRRPYLPIHMQHAAGAIRWSPQTPIPDPLGPRRYLRFAFPFDFAPRGLAVLPRFALGRFDFAAGALAFLTWIDRVERPALEDPAPSSRRLAILTAASLDGMCCSLASWKTSESVSRCRRAWP